MKKRILLVDDEVDVVKMLHARLVHQGYETVSVANGLEALGAFIASQYDIRYDLILLDLTMPRLNGRQVLHQIRKEEELRGTPCGEGIPIIIVTSVEEAWMDSFKHGCDDFILKPYDPDDLIQKVKEKIGDSG